MSNRRSAEVAVGCAGRAIPPGRILAEELDARRWSQEDLARITGRPIATINEIIKGRKAITPDTALDLAAALGTSPGFWLGLENDYRLAMTVQRARGDVERRARLYSLVPLRELQRRGAISTTDDIDQLEREVCDLLHIESITESPDLKAIGAAARKSDGYGGFTPAQITWLFLARRRAEKINVGAFNRRRFLSEMGTLPKLSADPAGWRQVRDRLAEWGVRLVFEPPLSGTKIDGALLWLDDRSPVVALSMRYDRVDHFWFTMMHELGHLRSAGDQSRSTTPLHVDADLVGPAAQDPRTKPPAEKEADNIASDMLVPEDELRQFVRSVRGTYFSRARILDFARQLGVHPGIVVGRLQYERHVGYGHCRDLLVKIREEVTAT